MFWVRYRSRELLKNEKNASEKNRGTPLPYDVGLIDLLVETGFSAVRFFWEKRHQTTRRSRATAPDGLESGVGIGLGLGLWLRVGSG